MRLPFRCWVLIAIRRLIVRVVDRIYPLPDEQDSGERAEIEYQEERRRRRDGNGEPKP